MFRIKTKKPYSTQDIVTLLLSIVIRDTKIQNNPRIQNNIGGDITIYKNYTQVVNYQSADRFFKNTRINNKQLNNKLSNQWE